MSKQQVALIVLLLVACVVIGVIIPQAGVVDALAPVGDGVNSFLHYLNQIN